jgi:hypothetical protein
MHDYPIIVLNTAAYRSIDEEVKEIIPNYEPIPLRIGRGKL